MRRPASGRQDGRVATQEFEATRPVRRALGPMVERRCDGGKYRASAIRDEKQECRLTVTAVLGIAARAPSR